MRADPASSKPAVPSTTEPAGSRDLKLSGTHATGVGTDFPPDREGRPAGDTTEPAQSISTAIKAAALILPLDAQREPGPVCCREVAA